MPCGSLCVYTRLHSGELFVLLVQLCDCLTEVRKAFNSWLSASAVTLQIISLLHSNQAVGSRGEKRKKKRKNITAAWESAQVPFLGSCPLFHGSMPFIAICPFPYLPLYSLLSVVSLAASASRLTAVATWNPPEWEGMWTYMYTWTLCVCVCVCVCVCMFACVQSWAELRWVEHGGRGWGYLRRPTFNNCQSQGPGPAIARAECVCVCVSECVQQCLCTYLHVCAVLMRVCGDELCACVGRLCVCVC